jgi:hypothetical protein
MKNLASSHIPNKSHEFVEDYAESLTDPCGFIPKGQEQFDTLHTSFEVAANKLSEALKDPTASSALTNPLNPNHKVYIEFFVANEIIGQLKARPYEPITRQKIAHQIGKRTGFDYSLFATPEPVLNKYTGLQVTVASEDPSVTAETLEANRVLTRVYRGYQSLALGLDISIDTTWLIALCEQGIITTDDPNHPHNRPDISLLAK